MKTTKDLLQEVRSRIIRDGFAPTNYRVAKVLEVSKQTVKNWDAGGTFDETSAAKVADYLGLDSGEVRLWMSWERAPDQRAKRDWEQLAKKALGVAAMIVLSAALLHTPPSFEAVALYIM